MFGFILEKNIEDTIKNECLCDAYESDYLNVTINSLDFTKQLDNSSFYYLISEELDISLTARVTIESADNILVFSKKEFEFDKKHELETFRSYIRVKTENVGTFVPFKFKFLKITPLNPTP